MTFEFIGRIAIPKESEKFKPYQLNEYASGWIGKRLNINALCDVSSHLMRVDALKRKDDGNVIYSFTKSENGKKGESIQIPFKERFNESYIEKVAEYRKFVIDLEVPTRRYKLENAAKAIEDGKEIDEKILKEVGLTNESEVKDALKESKALRFEFLSEWDFIDKLKEIIESEKYKDSKFRIRGTSDSTYSADKNQFYTNLVPTRFYLAKEDENEKSTATLKLLYGEDCVDSSALEEKGKHYINGYEMTYDSSMKQNIFVPTQVVVNQPKMIDEKELKRVERILSKFENEDETMKSLSIQVNMINGSPRKELTLDMLTEEQKEDIEFGLLDLEDLKRELGDVYGERVNEMEFVKLTGSNALEETSYTLEDMVVKTEDDIEDDDDFDLI